MDEAGNQSKESGFQRSFFPFFCAFVLCRQDGEGVSEEFQQLLLCGRIETGGASAFDQVGKAARRWESKDDDGAKRTG